MSNRRADYDDPAIDWAQSNTALAQLLGVKKQYVANARRVRGIPPPPHGGTRKGAGRKPKQHPTAMTTITPYTIALISHRDDGRGGSDEHGSKLLKIEATFAQAKAQATQLLSLAETEADGRRVKNEVTIFAGHSNHPFVEHEDGLWSASK